MPAAAEENVGVPREGRLRAELIGSEVGVLLLWCEENVVLGVFPVRSWKLLERNNWGLGSASMFWKFIPALESALAWILGLVAAAVLYICCVLPPLVKGRIGEEPGS
jgi:hypothetical protein